METLIAENTQESMAALVKKLHLVMKDVGYLKKDSKNQFHKYTYLSEGKIKERLHELFIKHGILFSTEVFDAKVIQTTNAKGNTSFLTTINGIASFHDVDTGFSCTRNFMGQGEDTGDKGLYKAITGGIKYLLTSQFLIPTGDDPENEKSAPTESEEAVEPQKMKLRKVGGGTVEAPEKPENWSDEKRKEATELEDSLASAGASPLDKAIEKEKKAASSGKISKGQVSNFNKTFREAVQSSRDGVSSKQADAIRHSWLEAHGYGESAENIPSEGWLGIRDAAVLAGRNGECGCCEWKLDG